MVDYKLYTVNDHLKLILRAAGVNGISTMNKADMVAWCEQYDTDNAPQTALELAPSIPPLKDPRTTANRAPRMHMQELKSTSALTDKENDAQDDDGDVQMLAMEQLDSQQQIRPEESHYNTWTDDQLGEELLRLTGAKKLDERMKDRPQMIKALQKLRGVSGPDSAEDQPQPNRDNGRDGAREMPTHKGTRKRKQPPTVAPASPKRVRVTEADGTSVAPTDIVSDKQQSPGRANSKVTTAERGSTRGLYVPVADAVNTAIRKSQRAIKSTRAAKEASSTAEEPRRSSRNVVTDSPAPSGNAGPEDDGNAPAEVKRKSTIGYGAMPNMKFDHLIPDSGLNMFEQLQRRSLRKEADIREAEAAGVPYVQPPPAKKAWDWRDHH